MLILANISLFRDAAGKSTASQTALKNAITRVALILAASAVDIDWEVVEADNDNEESMFAHRDNILSGFSVFPPPPSAPHVKMAVKAMLARSAMSKAERYWQKWKSWFHSIAQLLQHNFLDDITLTQWSA